MGKKYIIEYDRTGCIGAAACVAVFPEGWEMEQNGKATLLAGTAKKDSNKETLEIDEAELEKHLEAAKVCPVTVIHVTEKDTGKKLI